MLSRKSHVDFCMWSLSECHTKLWMLQLHIRKRTVFLPLGFDFPQLLNKFCVVLSVFLHIFMKKFFRYCEKVCMGIECTDRETYFHNGIKKCMIRIFYMNKISVLWMRSGSWNRCPIKLAWLIRLLVTFVGTRNLNRPTDMCKFKSSQKDKSRPVGRLLESFYSKSRGFSCWC